jgi:hypothetical protein
MQDRETRPSAAHRVVGVVPAIDEVVDPPGVEVDEVSDRVVGVRESGVDKLDVDELGRDEVDVVLLGAVVVVRGFGRVVVVGAAVVGEVVVEVVGEGIGTALGWGADAGRTRTYTTRVHTKMALNTAVEVRMGRRIRSGASRWSPALRAR